MKVFKRHDSTPRVSSMGLASMTNLRGACRSSASRGQHLNHNHVRQHRIPSARALMLSCYIPVLAAAATNTDAQGNDMSLDPPSAASSERKRYQAAGSCCWPASRARMLRSSIVVSIADFDIADACPTEAWWPQGQAWQALTRPSTALT